ncbi:MAG: hypothetical protein KAG95_05935 [Bacteroidales bacterium]|nr:hypothetical protein [Bacteroidales bacterium]
MKEFNQHRRFNNTNKQVNTYRRSPLKHVVLGILFVIVGAVIIGNRMDFISDGLFHIIISWQALLIGLGIMQLTSNRRTFGGIVLILIGAIFILPKLIAIPVAYAHLAFPLILIVIGLLIIFRTIIFSRSGSHNDFHRRFADREIDFSDDFVNEKCLFGGINLNVTSKQFKGGKIEAVFGGGKVNLLNAELSTEGKNVLEVDLVFGGIELIVPRDWNVVIKTNSVVGGFSEKYNVSPNEIDLAKELVIVGKTFFGGGEIKRF